MFPGIFQVCVVIPELIFYVPFNTPVRAHIFRAAISNLPFYSLQNTVEQ